MPTINSVFVLDAYHEDAIKLLQDDSAINVTLPNDPNKINWHGKADGVILRSETRLTAQDFAQASPRLKVVVKQGVGVDNIDMNAAKEHSVAVYNTPALNSETVAELCLAATLSLTRRVSEIDRRLRRGERVIRSQVLGLSMFQKTVGIIGMGNIGKEVAQKWSNAFGCRILGYDPLASSEIWPEIKHDRMPTLEELLQESDVITLHVPLIDSTKGMIGAKELGLMKRTAILVNCARGGLVDETALLKALQGGQIWGAALDAVEKEPFTAAAYPELIQCENVVITPHVGAGTIENQSRSGTAVVEILLKVLSGESVAGRLV